MILDSRILWSLLKTQNVTVSVIRQPDRLFLLFRVAQIADLGRGTPQLFLRPVGDTAQPHQTAMQAAGRKGRFALAQKIGTLRLTYAGAHFQPLINAYEAIIRMKGQACIEQIAPEVLTPGDFVVFQVDQGGQMQFTEALRAMTVKQLMNHKPSGVAHAL